MAELKELVNLESVEAIYKCGDCPDWYVCFDSPEIVDRLGDRGKVDGKEDVCINIERIDRFPIKFRIHWYPYHMNIEEVKAFMSRFGKKVSIYHETMKYGEIEIKTGAITGSLIGNERDKMMIPDTAFIAGKKVLLTVLGRQSLCLRCNQYGHRRGTCPEKSNGDTRGRKSYAEAARSLDVASQQVVQETATEEGEIRPSQDIAREGAGVSDSMVTPQDTAREGEGDGFTMVPQQDKAREGDGENGSGEETSDMEVEAEKEVCGKRRSSSMGKDGKKKKKRNSKVDPPTKVVKQEFIKSLPIVMGRDNEGGPNPGLNDTNAIYVDS